MTQLIPEGTQIGGYTLLQQLAEGGMGSVYRAERPGSAEPVALKILLPELKNDRDSRQRFEREVRAMQSLRHPHIIPVYDHGEDNGILYFAMRLVHGPSLFDLLNRRCFSPLTAWQILDPIAQALDFAHQHGVIHRDIKPGNILIEATNSDGQYGNHVYLADFGLSKIMGGSAVTKKGASLGTPYYMSPEQVMDQPLTPQSDVYSLAVVIYETLLGRLPFYGKRPQEVAFKHVDDEPPSPRSLHPDFPLPVDAVIMRAMAKSPSARFMTAGEFSLAYAQAVQAVDPEARQREYWVPRPE